MCLDVQMNDNLIFCNRMPKDNEKNQQINIILI